MPKFYFQDPQVQKEFEDWLELECDGAEATYELACEFRDLEQEYGTVLKGKFGIKERPRNYNICTKDE